MADPREALYEQLAADTVPTIVLSPGSQTDPLRCYFRLQKIPLSEEKDIRLPYEALSYTWGASLFPQRIICRLPISSSSSTATTIPSAFRGAPKINSTELTIPITQNLYDALVHLRHGWESRELWVDAICINQLDNVEKASQIPLMGRVYFHSKRVIIWLGLSDEDTAQTLALMNLLATNAKFETGLSRPTIEAHEREVRSQFDEARHLQRGLPSWESERGKWQALAIFLSRPWCSRVWILQEVILAPDAIVQVGDHSMDWADFCTAVTFLVQKYFSTSVLRGVTNLADCVDRLVLPCTFSRCVWPTKWTNPAAGRMKLCELLIATHLSQSTVPRDKVYALLALANEYSILVDYEVELRDVYVDVARHLLSKTDTCERSLCLASVQHYPEIDVEFPSWVPIWHVPLRFTRIGDGEIESIEFKFKAGGDYGIEVSRHSFNPLILQLDGFVLGRVETSHKIDGGLGEPYNAWDLLVFARGLLDSTTPYPTGGSVDAAIISTIITVTNGHDAVTFSDLFMGVFQRKLAHLASKSKVDEVLAMIDEWGAEISKLEAISQKPISHEKLHQGYKETLPGRKFFRTEEGFLGLGPHILEPGDLVCVLFGFKVPYVLRPIDEGFLLIGECYVHGVMNSESLREGRKNSRVFKIF